MRILRLKTILAATNLSESSDAALQSAARLASAAGAELHVVFVPANTQGAGSDVHLSSHAERLRRALEQAGAAVNDSRIHVVPGDPKTIIGPLAEAVDADVIVLGKHQPSTRLDNGALGATAHAVITGARVPCLVVSDALALPISRALVAVDESTTSRGALIVAITWASALRDRSSLSADLTALHVDTGRETPSIQATIDGELTALRRVGGDWAGVSVSGSTLKAPDPIAAIVGYANKANPGLVVLGTRALGGPAHTAFGSVAAAVTQRLVMPVLLVPPAVWRDYSRDIESGGRSQGIADAESVLR